jgi:uncharacterized protein with GYD domain
MAKFMIKASYTLEGVRGLVKEGGSGRRASAKAAVEGLGGKLEAFYFAFGEHDAYLIADLPDNVSAAALALRVNQAGAVQIQTVVLLTPEEVDKAVKTGVDYRPPGS